MEGLSPLIYNNQDGFGSFETILEVIKCPSQRFLYHAFLSRYFPYKEDFSPSKPKTPRVNRTESKRELAQIFRSGESVGSVIEQYNNTLADDSKYPLVHSIIEM